MADKLKWGIIGTGGIAKQFAKGLAESLTGQLVAVGSRAQDTADAFGKEFSVPEGKRYPTYDAMLADPDVQAVYISLPNHLHCEWTVKSARAGKHILCEKPAATNHAELQVMLEAVRAADVFFMEAFMYRCNPQTEKLVELIRSGVIGQIRLIQSQFSYNMGPNYDNIRMRNDAAGGGIMDVGCYPVSLTRLIAGAAAGADFAEPTAVKGVAHIGETSRVDEWASAVLTFPGDIQALIACGTQVGVDSSVRIWGSEGSIEVPNPWFPCRGKGDVGRIVVNAKGKDPHTIEVTAPTSLYAHEADVVARHLDARQAPSPAMTIEDTISQQKTLDQWREQVGLKFDREKFDSPVLTAPLTGMPLKVPSDHKIQYGRIEGIDKPISKAVLGTMMFNTESYARGVALMDYFFESGGNAFDSAYVYGGGSCEKALGEWVRSRGIREQVVILGKGAHSPMCYPEALTSQLFETLDRLQTDYVDCYAMHRDNPDIPAGEFVDVMNEHVKAGRFKVFGGSNWSIERIEEANAYARREGKQGFGLMSNNLALAQWNEPMWAGCMSVSDRESREWLTKHQFPNFAWSSQASGFFTGRWTRDDVKNPFVEQVSRVWFNEANFQRLERAQELAKKRGVTPIQIALAWVMDQAFPSFACIGPWKVEEVRTSLQAFEIELTPDELAWLALED